MTLKFSQITASAANFTTTDTLIGVQAATADRLFSFAQLASSLLTAPVIYGAMTYGGVALASTVTGTGSMVLDHLPTIGTATINNSTLGTATINNSTLGTATLNNSTINTATINNATLNTATLNTATLAYPTLGTATLNSPLLNTATIATGTLLNVTINTATINNPVINTAVIGTSTINSPTINTATINTATINNSTINTAVIGTSTINNSTIGTATINNSTIGTATINNSTINTATINSPLLTVGATTRLSVNAATGVGINVTTTNIDCPLTVSGAPSTQSIITHFTSATGAMVQLTDQGSKDWAFGVADGSTTLSFFEDRNVSTPGNLRLELRAGGTAYVPGSLLVAGTTIPSGGSAGLGIMVSTVTNFGIFFGTGTPSLAAATGSLYIRSDGSTATSRLYSNVNGNTTWTAILAFG